MALTKDEIDSIKVVIQEAVKPFADKLQENHEAVLQLNQTVYGVNLSNGLNGSVKKLQEQMASLLNSRAFVLGAVAVLQFLAVLIIKLWH